MKKIQFLFATFIFMAFTLNAQDFNRDLQGINKVKIYMSGSSDIKVISTDGNSLKIQSDDFEKPRKREGLRAIYSNGYDNSSVGLSIEEENGDLIVKKLKPMNADDYVLFIPKDMAFSLNNQLSGDIEIKGFTSEIEIKTLSGDIEISDVTGPILANTTSGDIKVYFEKVAQENPMSFMSVSGDIELVFPDDTKANMVMQTLSGTSYTNIDNLELLNKEKVEAKGKSKEDNYFGNFNFGFNENIKAKINGGGVKILVKTISGDIILRENE